MSKKEEQKSVGSPSKDNLSKMINASRAFRNLPPEFIMDSGEPSGEE